MMMNSSHLLLFSTLSLLLLSSLSLSSPNDTLTLTVFRLKTDTHGVLLTNWTGTTACSAATWHGVLCSGDRVISLSLPSLSLRGPIDSLSSLTKLRFLDLHNNRLNGTVSSIINLSDLKLVYLAGNDFSGEIPSEISSLRLLVRLDLSDNNLRGAVPETFSRLVKLLTLRLQNNVLSGEIPNLGFEINGLKELNLSNNELYGRVSEEMLRKFGGSSFLGNEGLCGSSPLRNCSFAVVSPVSNSSGTAVSNPSSFRSKPPIMNRDDKIPKKKLSTGAIVAIVIANSVVLLVIMSFVVAFYCSNSRDISNSKTGNVNKKAYESNHRGVIVNGGDSDRSKLVFYDSKKQFELEDLLRASAEMLGNGSLGTVYKAVLGDGCVMAVKRLKDANPCARKEFEQYMDVIGWLKHPNIVRLRAYYYAKEEKLLVYDYLPNGTLHYLLHGNRGPGRIPLDWTTRISIVLGAARGLAKIHEEYASSKLPHGNVRSSNILLDKNGVACISDFGLSLLLNPVHATARLGGYRAPEQTQVKRLSQKADVYSFGILLLEILTGKEEMEEDVDLPRWVRSVVRDEWTAEVFDQELLRYKNIEEELVSMLQVGMACVATQPEKRPTMDEVVKMIEGIRLEESPIGDDYDESRDSVSPSRATTEDGLGNY